MQVKQKIKQNDNVKIQNYIFMKNQLQAENATLLNQRTGIQQQFQYILSSNNLTYSKLADQQKDIQMNFQYSQPKKPHQYNFIQSVKFKLSEIITICQDHRAGEELNAIANAEKQILEFLDDIQNKKSQSKVQRSSKIKQIKQNKTQNFRILLQENKDFEDQAYQIIQQIQRKAFIEIQNLRNDKINLLKKLNQQIKSHNQQKKLRMFYQSKLKKFPKQYNSHAVNRIQVIAQQNQQNYDKPQAINQHPQNHLRIQKKKRNKKYITSLSHFNPQSTKNIYQINFIDPDIQNQNANFPTFRGKNVTLPLQSLTKISPKNKGKFSQQQILNSLSNLKFQNQRLKQQPFPIQTDKSQLRAQLYELSDRIRYYQQKIYSSNQNKNDQNLRQLQSLLDQGNYLSEQVKKLLRLKRMSQDIDFLMLDHSKSLDLNKNKKTTHRISYQNENNQQSVKKAALRSKFDYTRPKLQTFSPLNKTFHSQTFRSNFSPTKYENLIAQMNNATKE